jgi:hypothetical protein
MRYRINPIGLELDDLLNNLYMDDDGRLEIFQRNSVLVRLPKRRLTHRYENLFIPIGSKKEAVNKSAG